MGKNLFTMLLVAALGIILGVGIVTIQSRDPLVVEMMKNQETILRHQLDMEKKMVESLETRITTLESNWKNLEEVFKGPGQKKARAADDQQEDYSKVYDVEIAHSYVRGNKEAPVTIVEFVDFQCPYCSRFYPPVLETLKAYPQQVKYVLKNYPLSFHPMAKPASKAAFAAGEQGKYWEMVDALLENPQDLGEDKFNQLAEKIGLNLKKFKDDFRNNDAKYEEMIQKDLTLGNKVRVRGTPTFFLNGRQTTARDFGNFKTEIDEILKKQK